MATFRTSVIFLLALALGACTGAALSKPKTVEIEGRPLEMPTPTPQLLVDDKADAGDGAADPFTTWSKSEIPRWESVRTDVGGLPVPKGWKLVQREVHGYQIDETYQSPNGVDPGATMAWYRRRVPFDEPWGGWTPCGIGTGANSPGIDTWAFRNPEHTDHVIQMEIGYTDQFVSLYFQRNGFGDCGQDGS
jgi:hypothetical protein